MDTQDISGKNFTPLKNNISTPKQTSKLSFALVNVTAFMVALSITSLVYFTRISSDEQTTTTQASGGEKCNNDVIMNPRTVRANALIDGKIIDIKKGDTEETQSITFNWDASKGAQSYYVVLNHDTAQPMPKTDPGIEGIEVRDTKFTFDNLNPGTTYNLYIRAKGYNNKLGFSYPQENNCNFFLAAERLFYFNVK